MHPDLAFAVWAQERQRRVEEVLDRSLAGHDGEPADLVEAMRYAVLGGGKRMRPLLAYARGELVDGEPRRRGRPAAAVEMVHAYSLAHDDLPCMDDDVLRRGKPTCHVAFGEAMALLAGDALQAQAFAALVSSRVPRCRRARARSRRRRRAAGHGRGQAIDLLHVGKPMTLPDPHVHASHEDGRAHSRVDPPGRDVRPALERRRRSLARRLRARRGPRIPGRRRRARRRRVGRFARQDRRQGRRAEQADLRDAPRAAEAKRHAQALRDEALGGTRSLRRASAQARRARRLDHAADSTDVPIARKHRQPADLRKLERTQLRDLARELRAFLLYSVAKTGGILSSNLGTVELTVALHYVFDTPKDRIVWDVGHQTYAHKILTGRREAMCKLRQWEGPSGFPAAASRNTTRSAPRTRRRRSPPRSAWPSPAKLMQEERHVVAVIGDGAMSAGMAFEALNNAQGANLLVILNDNEMSISEPVGAFNNYLAKILSGRLYNTVRAGGKEVLAKVRPMHDLAKALEEHMKGMVLPGTLFEEFGFNYIGPIDGHDLDTLVHRSPTCATLGPAVPARHHEEGLRVSRRPRRTRSSTTA
jgi:hypothetical protein